MLETISIVHRNKGHWDIHQDNKRIYKIRGTLGRYIVLVENVKCFQLASIEFKTVSACMAYICDTLMFEEEI